MKMIFAADEVVKVREQYCGTWDVKKQEIADFLIEQQRERHYMEIDPKYHYSGDLVLERAVILSNLTNVISIEVEPPASNRIELYPIGIKMIVNESIVDFLYSKSKYH